MTRQATAMRGTMDAAGATRMTGSRGASLDVVVLGGDGGGGEDEDEGGGANARGDETGGATTTRTTEDEYEDEEDSWRRKRRAGGVRAGGRRMLHREKNGFDWTTAAAMVSAVEAATKTGDEAEEAEEGERWRLAEESDVFQFRGSWLKLEGRQMNDQAGPGVLDAAFQEKVKGMKETNARFKTAGNPSAAEYAPGGEAYEAFLGEHVEAHVRLARKLSAWRLNFVIRFSREPEYADMPTSVRNIELDWISLGFKIRAIESI